MRPITLALALPLPLTPNPKSTEELARGGEGSPLESEVFRQNRGRFSKLYNEVWSAWGLFRHTIYGTLKMHRAQNLGSPMHCGERDL